MRAAINRFQTPVNTDVLTSFHQSKNILLSYFFLSVWRVYCVYVCVLACLSVDIYVEAIDGYQVPYSIALPITF